MKLYTEKEVRKAIELAQKCEHDCGGVYFFCDNPDEVLEQLTPIELPSDEEIEEAAKFYFYNDKVRRIIWRNGAKWIRDKILPF